MTEKERATPKKNKKICKPTKKELNFRLFIKKNNTTKCFRFPKC